MGDAQNSLIFALLLATAVLNTHAAPSQHLGLLDDPAWSDFQSGESVPLLDVLVSLHTERDTPLELRAALGMLGEFAKTQLGAMCSITSMQQSCVTIDKKSSVLAKMCGVQHTTVDCMFYSEDIVELQQTPIDMFMAQLPIDAQIKLKLDCPECMRNLQALWCAQALPKCGTFNKMLNETLLPMASALRKHVQQLENARQTEGRMSQVAGGPNSDDQIRLPADWLDAMQANISRYLPCRRMCEAVVSTCTCGEGPRPLMGPSLQALIQGTHNFFSSNMSSMGVTGQPESGHDEQTDSVAQSALQQAIEGAEGHVPLCHWFPEEEHPLFAGHCIRLPTTCLRKDWCNNVVQAVDMPSVPSARTHGIPTGPGGPSGTSTTEVLNITLPPEVMLGAVFKTIFGWRLPADVSQRNKGGRMYMDHAAAVTPLRVLCALGMLGMLASALYVGAKVLSNLLQRTLQYHHNEHYYIQLEDGGSERGAQGAPGF